MLLTHLYFNLYTNIIIIGRKNCQTARTQSILYQAIFPKENNQPKLVEFSNPGSPKLYP